MKFNAQTEIDERQKTLKAVLHYFYRDNAKSGSHSRYSLQYHLVWSPKYRRSFLLISDSLYIHGQFPL